MTEEEKLIEDIFIPTARRCVGRQSRYHVLDRTRLSEPEVRYVMSKILCENRIYHGIEIPTGATHNFSDTDSNRRALVDLVIFNKALENSKEKFIPSVFVELKRSQPQLKVIYKDFVKILKEPHINGACFFHILPKIRSDSIARYSRNRPQSSILTKYNDAYNEAKKELGNKCVPKWFILFILDAEARQYYSCRKDNICDIAGFDNAEWKPIK